MDEVEDLKAAYRRRWMVAGVILLLMVLGGWLSLPRYRQWKLLRFQLQARTLLQATNVNGAWLASQNALSINPSNVESLRIAGEVLATANQPQAVAMRRRVAELEPDNVTNWLMWAQTALAFERAPFPETMRALEGVQESARGSVEYQFLSAGLELKRGNVAAAERHFAKVLELSPTNAQARINLAVLQLQSTNAAVRAAAQATLEGSRTNAESRISVLRSLAGYCRNSGQLEKALGYSEELLREAQANFQDKLAHLELLRALKKPEAEGLLTQVQQEAAAGTNNVPVVLAWMRENEPVERAFAWLNGLPKAIQAEVPVQIAAADLYASKKDWAGMQDFLKDLDWRDREFLRHALVAYAQRNAGETESAGSRWKRAVFAAENQSQALATLVQLASAWGWNKEVEDLLNTIVAQHPSERWASDALLQAYFGSGNTAAMRKVFGTMAEANGKDLAALNNYAATSFLLKESIPAPELEKAHRFAKEVYEAQSTNANFIATYAYSLHVQGKTKESLELFRKLNEQQLSDPSTAVYYGVVAAAAGERAAAVKALELGAKASPLPEERQMAKAELEKLKTGVNTN